MNSLITSNACSKVSSVNQKKKKKQSLPFKVPNNIKKRVGFKVVRDVETPFLPRYGAK